MLISTKVEGRICITDADTGEVLVEKNNAINPENMSQALALSVADRANGHIYQMVFGDGGSTVSSVGTITYYPPNVTGIAAALYNQTYAKVVDDQNPLDTDIANNFITVSHTNGTTYTDVQITCTLNYNEPSGQPAFDNAPSTGAYEFDELGLMSYATSGSGLLLSHVIFNPIQKSLNRSIKIVYTIRIIAS